MNALSNRTFLQKGFTLIEMTIVIIISIILAISSLGLLNQSLFFYEKLQTRSFLTEEAPMVGLIMSKLINDADQYELHSDYQAYQSGSAQLSANARCLTLISIRNNVRTITGHAYMNFNTNALEFYKLGSQNPDWIISNVVEDSTFSLQSGILRMTVIGSRGESITYSGEFKL